MSRAKEIITAAGTLACALGIGFVMQSSETAAHRYGSTQGTDGSSVETPVKIPAPVQSDVEPDQQQVEFIEFQDITLTSALPQVAAAATTAVVAPELQPEPQPEPEPQTAAVETQSCDIIANARARSAAIVALDVVAPCHTFERVTVHHNGMFFTEQTDESGGLSLEVPSLAEKAVYIFAFSDGLGAVAQTETPDLAAFNRVVLQWRGQEAGFGLHAREFGAEYGVEGHVWRESKDTSMDRLIEGKGGHLLSLGNVKVVEPHIAEIYTFPADMSGRNGHVDLSVEAEVTARNCGLEIEAQTIERDGTGRLRTQNLTLAMPGCDTIGDYLVLNNVLEDMKVAAQ